MAGEENNIISISVCLIMSETLFQIQNLAIKSRIWTDFICRFIFCRALFTANIPEIRLLLRGKQEQVGYSDELTPLFVYFVP
jgi:hypothetical protein